jgi:hypothetical protein
MILALDLSTACTGWAKYSREGKLLDFGRIIPDDKLHRFEKIKFIVGKLEPLMLEAQALVVEGIFLNTFAKGAQNVTGFELLARLSGASINSYLQNHAVLPVLYKATEARKLVGVKSSCQKAEVQVWAIRKFRLGMDVPSSSLELKAVTEDELDEWENLIDAEYALLNAKEIVRETFKKHMSAISKTIEEETGIGEDVADAILLGLAYYNDSRNPKVEA